MGFENRDYFRDGSYTRGGNGESWPMRRCVKRFCLLPLSFSSPKCSSRDRLRSLTNQHQIDQIQAEIEETEARYGEDVSYDADGELIQRRHGNFDPQQHVSSAPPISVVQDWLWKRRSQFFCRDRSSKFHPWPPLVATIKWTRSQLRDKVKSKLQLVLSAKTSEAFQLLVC